MIKWEQGQKLLGEYLIEKEIGQSGGMGRVWLVKSNSTGRRFAVKQTKLKDDNSRKAFLAELQTWIDLPEHPDIVPCRFFRTVGDEIVIFTDYIEGGSLADWISNRKLTTLEQILDVAIQFAWGLHAIHERGLVHQDVKPGNVLMTAGGVPMVADFGLARARQVAPDGEFVSPRQPNGQHSVLVPGSGFMTKAYASPEQRAGQPLSRKTDIWSWGVSVLDMFMGGVSCPHGGHIAADVLEFFVENGGKEEGLPRMPVEVADILRKCFARDPAMRWVDINAAAFASMKIYHIAAGRAYSKQVQVNPVARSGIVPHDRQGFAGAKWKEPREWLRKAYKSNGRDPNEADTFQISPAYSRKGAAIADLCIMKEAERQYMDALKVWDFHNAQEYAHLLQDISFIYEHVGDTPGSLETIGQSIGVMRHLVAVNEHPDLSDILAGALVNKAITLMALHQLLSAQELLEQSISIWRRLVEQEGRKEYTNHFAYALVNMANLTLQKGDLSAAVKWYDQGINLGRWVLEHEGHKKYADTLANALANNGVALRQLGNIDGAAKACEESVELFQRLIETEGRTDLEDRLAAVLMNQGMAMFMKDELYAADRLLRRSIKILTRLEHEYGRYDLSPQLANALSNLGTVLQNGGYLNEASIIFDQSVNIWTRLVEVDGHQELINNQAAVIFNKANTFRFMEKWEDALKAYDQCIATLSKMNENGGQINSVVLKAKATIMRADVLRGHGIFSYEEQQIANNAYAQLIIAADNTDNFEIRGFIKWASTIIKV